MWQPFTEEHQQFRKTVRSFAEKELAPHAEEWEHDERFPNWVFKRAGDLGILGAHFPEEHGGAGGDYWFSVAKAEELVHAHSAGVGMGLLVQGDMATPCISDLGTTEQIEEFLDLLRRSEVADARSGHVSLHEEAHAHTRRVRVDELLRLGNREPIVPASATVLFG